MAKKMIETVVVLLVLVYLVVVGAMAAQGTLAQLNDFLPAIQLGMLFVLIIIAFGIGELTTHHHAGKG